MNQANTSAQVQRVLARYPRLTHFMRTYWNEHYDQYANFAAAVETYVRESPEGEVRAFLAESRRAAADNALRGMMRRQGLQTARALAQAWGGMSLADRHFEDLPAHLQRCLDDRLFLSQEEIARRKARFAHSNG